MKSHSPLELWSHSPLELWSTPSRSGSFSVCSHTQFITLLILFILQVVQYHHHAMSSKAPPTQRILQPNNTAAEGGRPRWRPCQLYSQEEQGNGHHHHHPHHHQYHQHQQQPGGNRAPARRSRRHVPGHALGGANEGGDADQQAHPVGSRYRRGGEGEHHKTPQQKARKTPAVPPPATGSGISPTLDTLSSEESSQEVLTPSPQEDLNPAQEELIYSPQEVPAVEDKNEGDPRLHCSSSTESSLHTHSEQTEDQPGEREQTEKCRRGTDRWQVDECQEKKDKDHPEAHQEGPAQKESMINTSDSKGCKKTSRRSRPIRVDVPPFEEFQPPPHFQSFSGFPIEPMKGPNHLTTSTSTATKPESHQDTPTCEETFSDSTSEACSTTYPTVCPTFYPVTSNISEVFHSDSQTGWYQEQSEEQQSLKKNHDMFGSEAQISLRVDQNAWASVGSRLHHYDEQSGDEASGPDRGRMKVCRHSEEEECSESRKEQCDGEEKLEHGCLEYKPQDIEESVNVSGDVISLAIKDMIEEVKMKTMCSPYMSAKPEEPLWVRRKDVSPEDEFQPQFPPPLSSPQTMTSFQVSVADAVVPHGAESSRTPEHNKLADISASVPTAEELRRNLAVFPAYVDVPGPCDPEDLIDGIIFAASFLGSTQLQSKKTASKSARMRQAQEAMTRVRAAGGDILSITEVDLFVSTQRIKVLNADTQEIMLDHPLRIISYIADIGNVVVLMARTKMILSPSCGEQLDSAEAQDERQQYRMICHVFESEDAQLIAQSIGQSFSVAYQEFLRANGINPEDLSQREYSDLLSTQDMYNDDLSHFTKSENCRDVYIEKQKGEVLGVVIVESGWGSILPTVIIASLMSAGPAAKSGCLNIGDQIMTVNGTSVVGLPLATCQSIIKGLKSQCRVKMNIVRCPPVTMVLIRRPDLRYQLGFSVQKGIVCSLMRGGIAERGGVRVGHRIIDINGQSVVATPHQKIVHILSSAVGEIHMKTMPAAMYRLLTAQEQPVYI